MALRFRTDMWHIKTEHTFMLRLLCSLASLNITVVSSKPGAHPMGEDLHWLRAKKFRNIP